MQSAENDVTELNALVSAIHCAKQAQPTHVLLVGISGIDGSGKSFIAQKLAAELESSGLPAALIGLDPWRTAPEIRFQNVNSGEHFYRHAYRFDELYSQLIDPLKRDGDISLAANILERDGSSSTLHYKFEAVQVVLLEGIFLFKREMQTRFDLRVWIDCSFKTALKRALKRNQEGVSIEQLTHDYNKVYRPAQEFHLHRDNPVNTAHIRIENEVY